MFGAFETDMGQGVTSTYGELVSKSQGFYKRLKILNICEATGHLGNLEFTTGTDA